MRCGVSVGVGEDRGDCALEFTALNRESRNIGGILFCNILRVRDGHSNLTGDFRRGGVVFGVGAGRNRNVERHFGHVLSNRDTCADSRRAAAVRVVHVSSVGAGDFAAGDIQCAATNFDTSVALNRAAGDLSRAAASREIHTRRAIATFAQTASTSCGSDCAAVDLNVGAAQNAFGLLAVHGGVAGNTKPST